MSLRRLDLRGPQSSGTPQSKAIGRWLVTDFLQDLQGAVRQAFLPTICWAETQRAVPPVGVVLLGLFRFPGLGENFGQVEYAPAHQRIVDAIVGANQFQGFPLGHRVGARNFTRIVG